MLFNPIELTELNSKELKYLHFEKMLHSLVG